MVDGYRGFPTTPGTPRDGWRLSNRLITLRKKSSTVYILLIHHQQNLKEIFKYCLVCPLFFFGLASHVLEATLKHRTGFHRSAALYSWGRNWERDGLEKVLVFESSLPNTELFLEVSVIFIFINCLGRWSVIHVCTYR